MEKKIIKKPKKQPKKKPLQKQKQKQSVKVTVNIGKDGKPQMVRNPNPEITMYAPNIYTRLPAVFSETPLPQPFAPPQPAREPVRQPNLFGVPPRPQNYFFPESSRVEILPYEERIVNELTDDPYEVVEGINDNYNPSTGLTTFTQTQNPTDFVNPLQNNLIENIENTQPTTLPLVQANSMSLESIYNMPNEDFESPNYITVSTPSTPRIITPFPLYEETRNNLNRTRYYYTYASLRQLPIEEITQMMYDNNLSILTDTGRKKTKEMMIQSLRANVKK